MPHPLDVSGSDQENDQVRSSSQPELDSEPRPSNFFIGSWATRRRSSYAQMASSLNSWNQSYSRSWSYMSENISVPGSERTIAGSSIDDIINEHSPRRRPELPVMYRDVTRTESPRTRSDGSIGAAIIPDTKPRVAFPDTEATPLLRHKSSASDMGGLEENGEVFLDLGKSTFAQSLYNSMNILIGIAILSFPLSFKYGGWILGSLTLVFSCLITSYTAKILANCLSTDSALVTYGGLNVNNDGRSISAHQITIADIGVAAFGPRIRTLISTLFLMELIAASVGLVILLGDSLQVLFPAYSSTSLKVATLFFLTPTTFLAMHHLSYTSILGILSSVTLTSVVLYDGLTKREAPGSLWEPMPTNAWPSNWMRLPFTFGLCMAGFAGHAVFPNIYRDMMAPEQYPKVVNMTYIATAFIYTSMAVTGYLMFGENTMQEITQNLMTTPGYSPILNQLAVWLIVVNPLTKYALTLNPINVTVEIWLFRHAFFKNNLTSASARRSIQCVSRVLVSAGIVGIAVLVPGFDRVMSLLGSLFSFTISAMFPLLCNLRMFSSRLTLKEGTFNVFLLGASFCMATVGTIWSFLPDRLLEA
ncbi:hypothetical protein BZG36_01225 [Bifiguratus adelaidae]|uniref:Amino acid transporter transmembrane domain-containing protein n=1 Tax=Bifiguratus adelaidae TaxID=1938954 RepID=A0A261Y5Q5_9FUNG|nr:hypothetical protein BZG36_01225 [Bifiguratus adelaidae]